MIEHTLNENSDGVQDCCVDTFRAMVEQEVLTHIDSYTCGGCGMVFIVNRRQQGTPDEWSADDG